MAAIGARSAPGAGLQHVEQGEPDRLLDPGITGHDDVGAVPEPVQELPLPRCQPDPAMRAYLARILGHALEGRTVSHIVPIFHGEGGNGKSTLVDAVMTALGDYADAADAGLLTARSFDAHPPRRPRKRSVSIADLLVIGITACRATALPRAGCAAGQRPFLVGDGESHRAARCHADPRLAGVVTGSGGTREG